MSKSPLTDAFAHNAWATLQLLDACMGLTDEQLATTVPGTYGSIVDTLRHVVGADAGYLFVLTGGRVPMIDEDDKSLDDLRAISAEHAAEWPRLLAEDRDPDEVVTRHRDDGSASHAPLGVRLAQVVHHGTDHRSQVCTALTTLGIEPPEIDVWAFGRRDGRAYVTDPTS